MRELHLLLLAALLSYATTERGDDPQAQVPSRLLTLEDDAPKRISIPLDYLVMKAQGDVALMFGFNLLQELRNIHMECQIIQDQEQAHYTSEMSSIKQYYEDNEKVFSQPGMEAFLAESRKDIEGNLKNTMTTLERQRTETLQRLESECKFRMDSLLTSKKAEALSYMRYLLQHDPAEFVRLCMDVGKYSNQLELGVSYCRKYVEADGKDIGGDPCYGAEVTLLVQFINQFVTEALTLMDNSFGDDEDYYSSGQGEEGSAMDDQSPSSATAVTDPIYYTHYPTEGEGTTSTPTQVDTSVPTTEKTSPGSSRPTEEYTPTTAPTRAPTTATTRATNRAPTTGTATNSAGTGAPSTSASITPTRETEVTVTATEQLPATTRPTRPHRPVTRPPPTQQTSTTGSTTRPETSGTPSQTETATTDTGRSTMVSGTTAPTEATTLPPERPTTPPPQETTTQATERNVPDWWEDAFEEVDTGRSTMVSGTTAPTEATTPPERPTTPPSQETTTQATERNVPDWVEDAFEDVENFANEAQLTTQRKEGNSEDSSQSDSAESDSDVEVDATVDLDVPGVGDVSFEVEVGSDGVKVEVEGEKDEDEEEDFEIGGHVEIIYSTDEPITDTDENLYGEEEEEEEEEEGERGRYHRYLMVYTVTTFSILVVLAIVLLVLCVAIVRRRHSWARHLPLLSEEQKISVLKQSGYINPTYQFFDQTTKT